MSEQPVTYERLLEQFDKADRRIKKIERLMKLSAQEWRLFAQEWKERSADLDRQMKETDKKISKLGSRIGEIVENMIGNRIVNKFQALGYSVTKPVRNHSYKDSKLGISGEFDLMLIDGDIVILIEVKTLLETADVRRHIDRIEKYRRFVDSVGFLYLPSTRFIGAVAGAIVKEEAKSFAHENGMYVIVQSGEAVEIVEMPEGVQVKEW